MTGNCSLFCPQCSFGTHNLENFAEHFGSCLPLPSQSKNLRSLSVTCSLHHCSVCGWITSAKNMLLEHLHESHPGVSETAGVITEEFTVPRFDDPAAATAPLTEEYQPAYSAAANSTMAVLSAVTSKLGELSGLFSGRDLPMLGHGNLPVPVSASPPLRGNNCVGDVQKNSSFSNAYDTDGPHPRQDTHTTDYHQSDPDTSNLFHQQHPQSSPAADGTNKWPATQEYVQLYFNEAAFVAAYTRNEKLGLTNRAVQSAELTDLLEKLRRFAGYRVPILGRANQRRVAGCPVCLKAFNHGFTDLKKHLMIAHLNVRRTITRFALDFTHYSRSSTDELAASDVKASHPTPELKQQPLHRLTVRPPSRQFRRRSFIHSLNSTTVKKRTVVPKLSTPLKPGTPTSTEPRTPDELFPLVTSPTSAYIGGAPVHRVIPGTGVSDQYEDMKTLEEVASEAPAGRGGIIHLDDAGKPLSAALAAASQPHTVNATKPSDADEVFLPRLGRQHVQLAYSYPVFKRLLEAYQVPMAERIQLVNRMNHYARMHVIMDVLVPSGAQKRFSCPTCMYTSVHSLADIRKHIMGSHCGISTKRFRLCLRASRHDTTTYRLHSDDRMIRFVQDHRRRQMQSSANNHHVESDEDVCVEKSSVHGNQEQNRNLGGGDLPVASRVPHFRSNIPTTSQEELETMTIEADPYDEYEDEPPDEVHRIHQECDNRFLTATPVDSIIEQELSAKPEAPADAATMLANTILKSYPEETSRRNEEIHRRVTLPYSTDVLRTLLEREGLLEHLQDLLEKMEIYANHHLTVISRGNRIIAYICICGRRFSVIREDEDSVIRPASLADCRRHILGVHARIPQDLLTLCCQASRISKESGYKLYSDSSLLALAEQHKFRSARMQTYNKAGSPFRAANSADTSGANTDEYDMSSEKPPPSPDTSGRLGSNNVSYTTVSRLPSVGNRPPNWKQDPETDASGLDGPACTDLHNGSPPTQKAEPIAAATHKMENVNSQALAARHSGLDLEAPHRILTVDEAVSWGRNLSLPTTWTLERIVRLQYNESVFDEQLRRLLPNNELFVESLHERMRVYSRHAVYIARLHTTASPPQRIYVCCACLSTSQHGFGDVRKHILGVHAHIPERFKTIAMNSSRLNREDYSLQTENSAPISSRSSSSSHSRIRRTTLRKTGLNNLTSQHSSRKRSLTAVGSPVLRSHVTSPPRKKACSGDVPVGESFFSNGNESIRSPSDLHEDATSHTHLNGTLSPSGSKAPFREDPSRPPIILMLPRPKAFHPSRSPEQSDFSISGSDMERTLGDDLISAEASRSRRSMILKSKRPCPTTT
ncbi:hypothetical protein CLF_101454 [Clonorchis sinensis]|uniref:C2H2-type domain-containing protein n=1 Tax=Clonorchis sinensis TaxID=79923 RepID=H2KP75_CLOSI|nr:hypothetical protein CLF_101454 [Clonorchis sinensis]